MTPQTSQRLTPQERLEEIDIVRGDCSPSCGIATTEAFDWLIARIKQLESALEFYTQPDRVIMSNGDSDFYDDKTAIKALATDPIDVNANDKE